MSDGRETIEATVVDADGVVQGTRTIEKTPMQFAPPVVTGQLGSVAIAAHAAATAVLGQIVAAKQEPRDMARIKEEILRECKDKYFAEKALYLKPQGGGYIEGLGIFFAKYLYSIYEHLDFNTVEHNKNEGETQIQCTVWDKQRNNVRSETIIVLHKKYANRTLTNMVNPDDVRLELSRQKSFLERNCLLDVFNPALTQQCFETILATLDAAASKSMQDPAATIKQYADKFHVDIRDIHEFLNLPSKDPDKHLKTMHIRRLNALVNGFKEGTNTPERVFGKGSFAIDKKKAEGEKPSTSTETPAEKVKKAAAEATKTKQAAAKESTTTNATPAETEQHTTQVSTSNAQTATNSKPSENLTQTSESTTDPQIEAAPRDDAEPDAVAAPLPLVAMQLPDQF